MKLSNRSIDFGNINVGGISGASTVRLTNSGNAPLIIAGITVSDGFIQQNDCSNFLPAGNNCLISINFVPTVSGAVNGSLTINGGAKDDATHNVGLSGTSIDNSLAANEPPVSSPNAPGNLFSHDFNSDSLGTYTVADLKASWGTNNAGVSMKDHGTVKIVKDPANGARGNVMSVFFNAGGVGYQRFVCCNGAQWKTPVGPKDELYLSYDVMFEPGFDFALGGKLPGLFGGEFIGGGNVPTGYEGWSGRMMWKKGGTMIQYMYHAGMPNQYGQNFKWKNANGEQTRFIPGKWHTVEIRYVINTPGVADGVVQAWFDGKLALDTGKKFLFRKTDAFSINGLIVTTYFGGATTKWASPKDQRVFFDNFIISTKPITH